MTNGEKFINDYYPNSSITRDSLTGRVFVNEDNADFTLPIEWWDAEYKELTNKNDLRVDKLLADCEKMSFEIEIFNKPLRVVAFDAVKNIVKDLPSVTPQEPRWISVSDYLPVTNDEVLVTYIVNGNTKKRYVETANCFDGEWSSINDEYRIPTTKIEIIAWCEMPKPYREVEEV